ncbi:RNA polymerase sigma factor CnrH [Rubripirellula lacrimiformis]|uniref:RNA polymerase sigma factor CnrH n=1 Tax=Rubripirellula lacrimiformis TaxID=1930273 RepID=A0A517NLE2_9BACT|nr:sigma-70 family RNA polymerase sigma factor [Rubripirellula lacrimiformis]QDT07954.1 RNA polymerase sigma factor CnrH [Rubripirellula lacrimiformis]
MIEPSTPHSLLLAACDGQPQAWNRFVHLYGPLIYRWVRRSGMQSSDAADVTQDVLMSVSRDLVRFDPKRTDTKFRSWLWTITRRRMADRCRNAPAEQVMGSAAANLVSPIDSADPPTDARLDQHTVLTRAVAIYRDRFDPKTWEAFWGTVVDGRSPDEVAESLGVTRWTVYKARARILQRLRTELAGLIDQDSSG